MTPTGLDAFDDPASVAVVGASADTAKWGHWLARGAVQGAHRRRVYLVNDRANLVLDRPCYSSLSALPEVPQLVALAVPAPVLPDIVQEAADLGVAGMVSVTAGVDDDAHIHAALAGSGTRLIGPNCLGIYDSATELALAWGSFTPGSLAVVSQSGQLGLEVAGLAEQAGIGISRFVSVGSQLDVTAADILDALVTHPTTSAVALYLESFGDGPRTLAALDHLRRSGKPVLVLGVGSSEASRAAARSHTGAVTSDTDVVDAACRSVGAVRVDTPKQLTDAAALLIRAPRPRGPRIAIVTDGGGQGAIAADTADRCGLVVASVPDDLQAELMSELPVHASAANPVDLAGAGERDLRVYGSLVAGIAGSGAVDAVVVTGYFGSYARDVPAAADLEAEVARRMGRIAAATGVPVVVHSMAEAGATVGVLREHGVATFHDIGAALGALAVSHATTLPVVGRCSEVAAPAQRRFARGYFGARDRLATVRFPMARFVAPGTAVDGSSTADLPGPYVLKADWIEHKTELDAVAVGLPDLASVNASFEDMVGRLGHQGYVVEQLDMRRDVVELIVAARRDPVFGPTVLVGAGGLTAELDPDTALELAPCTPGTAAAMLRRLRIWPLLQGWRGRPGVDLDSLVATVVAVSDALCADVSVAEIELNPVRASVDGALAVDALVVEAAPIITAVEGDRLDRLEE